MSSVRPPGPAARMRAAFGRTIARSEGRGRRGVRIAAPRHLHGRIRAGWAGSALADGYPAGVFALQVVVFLLGFLGAARTVLSAVRTFVVPRGDNDRLTRAAFRTIRKVFALIAPPSRPYEFRDRVMAYYGPIALILLPAWWLVLL